MEYYDEMLNDIQDAFERKDLDEVAFLLKRELRMPYIPEDVELKLQAYMKRLKFEVSAMKQDEDHLTMEQCLRLLKGKSASQLKGAYGLLDKNLRSCLPQIRDWLSKDPCLEAGALIVDALAEQDIAEEFVWIKNGVEYTFDADVVVPVEKSEGFHKALSVLQKDLVHEPALLQMAREMLIHEAYVMLPLSIDPMEAEWMARQVENEVTSAMQIDWSKQQEREGN